MRGSISLLIVLMTAIPSADAQNTITVGPMELHSTFRSIGITIPYSGDANDNTAHTMIYRESGTSSWLAGHGLTRVDNGNFIGSIVLLEPETTYEVHVDFSDPDGVTGSPCTGTVATWSDQVLPPTGDSWYVAPGGSNGSAGTEEDPFETVAYALGRAAGGDAIYLEDGIYHQSADLSSIGSLTDDPIFVIALGDSVVFDGSDPTLLSNSGAWSDQGSNVWYVDLGYSPFFVAADDTQLYRYTDYGDFTGDVNGLNAGYYQNPSNRLFVRFPPGTSPSTCTVHVAALPFAFHLYYCENIVLDGIQFNYYGSDSWSKAIYVDGSKKIVIRGCGFFNNTTPIWVKRQAEDNSIENCTFETTSIFNWRWSIVKGTTHETSAIAFSGGFTGRRNVIRNNRIKGYFDGMGLGGDTGAGYSYETDVYGNVMTHIPDDLIETDGTSSNIRIWGNTFSIFHMGISVAPGDLGPTYVFRNVFYDYGNTLTNTVDGYPASQVKFNHGYSTITGPMYFYHNTSSGTNGQISGLLLKTPGTWELLKCRNNIWLGTSYAFEDWDGTRPCDMDYDCAHTTGGPPYARISGITYQTLNDYQTGTGQEMNGWDMAPTFENPSSGDFRLASGDPLIDQGVFIPGFSNDYLGSGPDPGAYEFGAPGPPAVLGLNLQVDNEDLLLSWTPVADATYNVYDGADAYELPDMLLYQGWPADQIRISGGAVTTGSTYYDVRAWRLGEEGPPSPDRVGKFSFSTDSSR